MPPADRPILARDLAGTVAYAGVDPTLEGRALQDALRVAIAHRRGYCSWTVDHASWVVTLYSPEEEIFSGRRLEEGVTWCLVWLMAKGTPGDGSLTAAVPFRINRRVTARSLR